jgi:hypothetical protein
LEGYADIGIKDICPPINADECSFVTALQRTSADERSTFAIGWVTKTSRFYLRSSALIGGSIVSSLSRWRSFRKLQEIMTSANDGGLKGTGKGPVPNDYEG